MPPVSFRERLRSGPPLVLDAALGTELLLRGAELPPPLWSARALLDRPDLVAAIHRENAEAGADVLTIASFRLHARNIRKSSCSLSQGEVLALAVALARRAASEFSSKVNGAEAPSWRSEPAQVQREASEFSSKVNETPARRAAAEQGRRAVRSSPGATHSSKQIFDGISIAGSLAPLEDCYRPDRVPSEAEISSEHAEMASALARAGVDLILVETMNTVREAVAAARAAAATGLPVVVSCVTDGSGRLLSGEPVGDFASSLLALPRPPDALGINCVAASALGPDLGRLAAAASGSALAAYGNTFSEAVSPREYAALAGGWTALGARLVGGCCGTAAAHTRALSTLLNPR